MKNIDNPNEHNLNTIMIDKDFKNDVTTLVKRLGKGVVACARARTAKGCPVAHDICPLHSVRREDLALCHKDADRKSVCEVNATSTRVTRRSDHVQARRLALVTLVRGVLQQHNPKQKGATVDTHTWRARVHQRHASAQEGAGGGGRTSKKRQ